MQRYLVIGASDGIGLTLVQRLLEGGAQVVGVSRSVAEPRGENHEHVVLDVRSPDFRRELGALHERIGPLDVVVYCAGIGELFDARDPAAIAGQRAVFEVNLLGAVDAFEVFEPAWRAAGRGHFVVLSSLADRLVGPSSPAYNASKAAVSSYFEALAIAMKPHGVAITNIRLGFVDTKMAKGPRRPFMMSRARAVDVVTRALATRPIQRSYPWPMVALVALLELAMRLRLWWS